MSRGLITTLLAAPRSPPEWVLQAKYSGRRRQLKLLYVTLQPNSQTGDLLFNHDNFCGTGFNVWPAACLKAGDNQTDYASPRSRHPGGVFTVLCDGSVQFVENNVDTSLWRNLGFIADGG